MKASDLCVGISTATTRPVGGTSSGLAMQIFEVHPTNKVHQEVNDRNVFRGSLIETNSSGGTVEEEEPGQETEESPVLLQRSGSATRKDSQTRILELPAHRELTPTFPQKLESSRCGSILGASPGSQRGWSLMCGANDAVSEGASSQTRHLSGSAKFAWEKSSVRRRCC